MKIKISVLAIVLVGVLFISEAVAQDTTVVQTFTFNDISKRRGKYKFPDGSESYRKILMKYTLKCDPQTGRDKYDCGEWDYLTYNFVYGHDGKLDSTKKTHAYYFENSSATDSLSYITRPFYDYWRETQYAIRHTSTSSLVKDTVGNGGSTTNLTFASAEKVGRSQYIWKASELIAAGVSAGNISGIELDLDQLGSEMRNFEMKIGHTRVNSLSNSIFIDGGMTRVYRHNKTFGSTGFSDLQFLTPFPWNGTDNIVIDFSFEGETKGSNSSVKSDATSYDAGITVAGSNSYLNFNGNPQWGNLTKAPIVTGSKARTIEVWAKIDKFNNAGLFQAGASGGGRDFTLRTTTTVDQFRAQLWGSGDFNFTFPGALGKWHHYAMVYDGSKVSIYIDGDFIQSKTVALATPSTDFRLGRWQGNYLIGQLDELRVWDKALTSTTLKQWMNKTVNNAHADYTNLIGYYNFDEGNGLYVNDVSPKGNAKGTLSGIPSWKNFGVKDLFLNKEVTKQRPRIVFEKGSYTSVKDSTYSLDSIARNPVNLTLFENPAGGVQIPNNEPNYPDKVTRNILVWKANDYSDTYDKATGKRLAWNFIAADSTVKQHTKTWYTPDYRIEIGRYITPYGIGLSLGPNGFTWWYDVTDYVQYLRDSVDLQAGNQQELIDLQFLFIKGTPAREVMQVNRVWGQSGSISYKALDNDTRLSATNIALHKNSKTYRVKTRFTGHGHNSDDGNYPHCCEWKDNTHSLLVNGKKFSDWHIWQTNQCADNPVFPQGGTWPGAREGWCPGDVVKENEFEITNEVSGNSVNLDYSITPVPSNNQKMGNGNYVVSIHMVQYGKPNFANDVEVYDIVTPSNVGDHHVATFCHNPKVIIRNGGSNDLTNAEIRYRVSGGDVQVYKWTGNLKFMEMEEVEIPVDQEGFYTGDGSSMFNVRVCNPNGKQDEYAGNDEMNISYDIPKVYPAKVVVSFKTNNRPTENSYQVKDIKGNIVLEKKANELTANTTYNDTLDLPEGCYRLYLDDAANNGLYYGSFSNQGTGFIRFLVLDAQGNIAAVENFNNNFGRFIKHSFTINKKLGEFVMKNPGNKSWNCSNLIGKEEFSKTNKLSLFPNPSNGKVSVEIMNLQGDYELSVVSMIGRSVLTQDVSVDGYFLKELDMSSQPSGIYILQMKGENGIHTRRFVIEGN